VGVFMLPTVICSLLAKTPIIIYTLNTELYTLDPTPYTLNPKI